MPSLAGPGETLNPRATPGGSAHPGWLDTLMKSAAETDPSWVSRFLPPDEGGRESAVLLLFGPDPSGADSVLLIERSHGMRSHPGQVALPGGAADSGDADVVATALREAREEVNLDPSGVEVLGTLPPLFLPPSGFVVTTVVGWWREASPISVGDPAEVAQVALVPVEYLLDPATRHTVIHPSGYRGPGFALGEDLLLWGFTGGVVTKALELAGLDRPWDSTVTRALPYRLTRDRR